MSALSRIVLQAATLSLPVFGDGLAADNARPAALRRCDAHHPCRDDYICARAEGSGACIPPYLLFQLRVDGHP